MASVLVSQVLGFCSVWNVAAFGFCLLFWYWWRRPCGNFPPGPRGVPLLGIVPFLGKAPAVTFKKWSLEKYGPVMSVRMGPNDVVVLNTFEAIHQALVKQNASYSDRLTLELCRTTGEFGLAARKYNDEYKVQKHFGLKFLRETGLGKKRMDQLLNEEGDLFMEYISSFGNKPVDLKKYFYWLTSNVISKVALGKRHDYGDPDYQEILGVLSNLVSQPEDAPKLALICMFGFLGKIPPFSGATKRFDNCQNALLRYVEKYIDEHKRNFDPNNITTFIDAFLCEAKFRKTDHSSFTDNQLQAYCRDLFFAGTETSSATLSWCVAFLLNYPEYYEIIEKEIDDIIGTAGKPSMSKRNDMPMTCAFIQEVMRIRTLVPTALPHATSHTTKLMGYVIPKGTQGVTLNGVKKYELLYLKVLANLDGAHMDPVDWPNPQVFNPRRHIDENGKFVKSNKIIPFSIGSRFCIGESLARAEIFIFLVKFLQRFRFKSSKPHLPPVDEWIIAAVISIKECEVILTEKDRE